MQERMQYKRERRDNEVGEMGRVVLLYRPSKLSVKYGHGDFAESSDR